MKILSLVLGLILIAAGAACFLGMVSMSTPMALAFIVTGVVGVLLGLRRERVLVQPRSDHDLRDMR